MLYTITTFNTPTGWSLSLPRRKRVLELADEYEFIVLEDNVYGELRYDGEKIPTLLSLDTEGYVVRVDSFSKTLAPALRMGSVTGAPEVVAAMSCVRGDLGVSQFLARVVAKYVAEGLYDKHVEMVNELYRRKRDLAADALRRALRRLRHVRQPRRWVLPLAADLRRGRRQRGDDAGDRERRAVPSRVSASSASPRRTSTRSTCGWRSRWCPSRSSSAASSPSPRPCRTASRPDRGAVSGPTLGPRVAAVRRSSRGACRRGRRRRPRRRSGCARCPRGRAPCAARCRLRWRSSDR